MSQTHIENFVANHQQTYDTLKHWRSAILRPFTFACTVEGGSKHDPTKRELNSLLARLPGLVAAPFFEPDGVVNEYPLPPDEANFDTAAEYDKAYDEFSPKCHEPKPWLAEECAGKDIRSELLRRMKWSINSKRYAVLDAEGNSKSLAFSRDPDEMAQIEVQETKHRRLVENYVDCACSLFTNTAACLTYSTDHLLDNSDERADCCYFDETIVFANTDHRLLVWTGHIRYYG